MSEEGGADTLAKMLQVKVRPGFMSTLILVCLGFFAQRTVVAFDERDKTIRLLEDRVLKLELQQDADRKLLQEIRGSVAVIHDVIVDAHLIDQSRVRAIEAEHHYGDKSREE